MENQARFLLSIILTLVCVIHTEGYTLSDVNGLRKDILAEYSKTLRPVLNQSDVVNVTVGFDLVAIQKMDEVNEHISITVIMTVIWQDQSAIWNPNDYNGIYSFVTECGKFWTPNIILINTFKNFEILHEDWLPIHFYADGTAVFTPGSVLSASCAVDVTYYPWDTHTCEFIFSVWGFIKNEIQFVSQFDKVMQQYFIENGIWNITGSNVTVTSQGTIIRFALTLTRKPKFVIVNVILPIVFLSFLNIIVFAIPTESGERISYCLTVLLSITVFLTLISDSLPKTSNPMSIFCYYLLSILIISICITFTTILSLRIYYRDEERPIQPLLNSFARLLRCQRRKRSSRTQILDGDKHTMGFDAEIHSPYIIKAYSDNRPRASLVVNKMQTTTHSKHDKSAMNYMRYPNDKAAETPGYTAIMDQDTDRRTVYEHFKQKDHAGKRKQNVQIDREVTDDDVVVSWKDVSVALDKMFFLLFTCLLVIDTVIFWLVMTQVI